MVKPAISFIMDKLGRFNMFNLFKKKKKVLKVSTEQALGMLDQLQASIERGRRAVKSGNATGLRTSLFEIENLLDWFHETYVIYK